MIQSPVDSLALFPVLNEKLVSFLKKLAPADWQRQTVARLWVIKDVVAHLLDGNFRQIALHRDGWSSPPDMPIGTNQELVQYLNRLNADWVKATKRLSPALLIELLEWTNPIAFRLFVARDPQAPAVYSVSWAGEDVSYNNFDIAREYTERWLHQQQIREAMGDRELLSKELYHPLLAIFMQAWPFTLQQTPAAEGTWLKTEVTGEGGGEWWLKRENGNWHIQDAGGNVPAAETIIDGDMAWKLFSKSIRPEQMEGYVEIRGDEKLGRKVLDMVSVMA